MLELHKLLDDVDAMSQEAARRRDQYKELAKEARERLQMTEVNEALRAKIKQALVVDSTWRGAEPLEDTLDRRHRPELPSEPYSLIGVDGSQIYPDTHGPALYYLINTGSIVLREGSGEAPLTKTEPQLLFEEGDLYDREYNLVQAELVNMQREMAEMRTLAELAAAERAYLGGDMDHLVLAMKDGQLMLWIGEREPGDTDKLLGQYIDYLDELQRAAAISVGFVGRPRSANVVRLLWVAGLDLENITKETVRSSRYRALTDRALFTPLLAPNQRSAIFLNTAVVNREQFARRNQRICFFYMNVARYPGADAARIVRVDIPQWVAERADLVDRLQMAIYNDCVGTDFPYVLIRADELAVVSQQEKRDFEQMLTAAILKTTGTLPESSSKATQKEFSRGYDR